MTKSAIWDLRVGFGGNGNSSLKNPFLDGYCLTEGPFSMLEAAYIGPEYKPHCLSRGFESGENLAKLGESLKPEAVEQVLSLPDYDAFNIGLENGPHLAIPKIIAGDFQYFSAPNGMVFSFGRDLVCWKTNLAVLRSCILFASHTDRSYMVDVAADQFS